MTHSLRTLLMAGTTLAAALAPFRSALGQDTGQMAHDSMTMSNDSMGHDGMGKDSMGKDSMGMDKMGMDKMGMDKMGKDSMGMNKTGMDKMGMAPHGMLSSVGTRKISGSVHLTTEAGKSEVRLGDDFSAENAKGVRVLLGGAATATADNAVDLGKLKKSTGAQTYKVPSGAKLPEHPYLILWSKEEKVAIATADLASMGEMMHK